MTTTALTSAADGLDVLDPEGAGARGTLTLGQGFLGVGADSAVARRQRNLATLSLKRRQLQRKRATLRLSPETVHHEADVDEPSVETTIATRSDLDVSPVEILQRWDGVVLHVGSETFRARVLDERTGRPRFEADIYLSDVARGDLPLLRPNAIFYWHIGYRDPHGDRERFSKIRLRRLPPKTDLDLQHAERRVLERRKRLGWK